MSERIPCVVIGCKRTAPKEWAGEDTEIICGKHWRLVPASVRRRYSRLRRLHRKAVAANRPIVIEELERMEHRLWGEIKSSAIEAAVGIA